MLRKEGPSQADSKIRDDTFRTFKGDTEFWSVVDELQLIRVLNCFERYHFQNHCIKYSVTHNNNNMQYVQGMLVLNSIDIDLVCLICVI